MLRGSIRVKRRVVLLDSELVPFAGAPVCIVGSNTHGTLRPGLRRPAPPRDCDGLSRDKLQTWLRGSLAAQVVTRPGISNIQAGAVPENESLHGSKIRNAQNGIAFYEDARTLIR